MGKIFEKICEFTGWYVGEYIKDYRENNNRIFGAIVQKESQINAIILTGSVAGLTAITALSKDIFNVNLFISVIAFMVILFFIISILLSIINLYLSMLTLIDIQKKFIINHKSLQPLNKNMDNYKYKNIQRVLNHLILISFCIGLIIFLVLLGLYIFGDKQ